MESVLISKTEYDLFLEFQKKFSFSKKIQVKKENLFDVFTKAGEEANVEDFLYAQKEILKDE